MDEPFSALDPEMRLGLVADLKAVWDTLGTTVLIVSHNPMELDGLTERELCINGM